MGILFGFAPWLVFWVLVGNVPFVVAATIALVVAVAALVIARLEPITDLGLQLCAVATFLVVALLAVVGDDVWVRHWILTLSYAGALIATLTGAVIGKPFVRGLVDAVPPSEVTKSKVVARMTALLTWIWVGVFAVMTLASAIAALGGESILDTSSIPAFLGHWIVPSIAFSTGALVSRILPDRMLAGLDDALRETTFVAYSEATIDELYYLAQEHANREVGAGKEAYNVKVGGMGTPLLGEDSRNSWPSTYKVRDRRH